MDERISKLPKEEAERVLELPNSYREEGREEGITIGEMKGRTEGIELAKKQLVFNMLKKGMSYEEVAEIAELDIPVVEKMSKELEN